MRAVQPRGMTGRSCRGGSGPDYSGHDQEGHDGRDGEAGNEGLYHGDVLLSAIINVLRHLKIGSLMSKVTGGERGFGHRPRPDIAWRRGEWESDGTGRVRMRGRGQGPGRGSRPPAAAGADPPAADFHPRAYP